MATKTFEELKQMAIQIRDEKTNKQNTATRIGTQMLEHLNKLEQEYYNKENIDEKNKQTDVKFSELSNENEKTVESLKSLDKEAVKKNPESEQALNSFDSFKIVDFTGNVIFKVSADGAKSFAYKVYKKGKLIGTIDSQFFKNVLMNEGGNIYQDGDSLKICDNEGKVFCIISPDGVQAINFLDKEGNIPFLSEAPLDNKIYGRKNKEWVTINSSGGGGQSLDLEGYELFSLCDSLGQSGRWQMKFAEITGCTFDQEKNIKAGSPLSVGGTKSYGQGFDSMMWRAKNLVDSGYINDEGEKAIIILENVNDASSTTAWDSTSKLIIPTEPIEGYSSEEFGVELLNRIPAEKRILNACLGLTKSNPGKNLAITKLPEREGDITLTVGWAGPGNKDYNIHVVPQDSDENTRKFILDKILEYDYTGVTDTLSEDGISVNFSNSTSDSPLYIPTVIFKDTSDTGMTVLITDTDNAKTSVVKYFIGESVETDWSNMEKWIDGKDTTFSIGWKSTIEQLLLAYPKAHIFVSMFPLHAVTAEDFMLPNGYFDTDRYNKESRMNTMRHHQDILKEIAKFYSLPFINIFEECGIGITNMLTYYQAKANVHPKDTGYDRFGETAAGLVRRFL